MAKLSTNVTRAVIGLLVAAIVVVGGYFVLFSGSSTKTVTAQFRSAVGIYTGTPVRILGVDVGEVTAVKPGPDYVKVTMTYDSKYRIRKSDASAIEVANSLVSDRYIQLGTLISKTNPAPALANKATIPVSRTGGPAELDEIYAELDKLSVALGPAGANKGGVNGGALSELLKVSAANLKGNGAALGNSITQLAAAARTLSDHRGGLFGTVRNLQKFVATLKASDTQVRLFNTQLATVAGQLASERTDLGAALQQLGLALDSVNSFIKGNAAKFHTTIGGLRNITDLLVRQKASLQETLSIAPVALANLVHTYNPQNGSLGTRSNLVSLFNLDLSPTQVLCETLTNLSKVPVVGGIVGLTGLTDSVCKTVKSSGASHVKLSASEKAAQVAAAQRVKDAITKGGSTAVDTMLNGGVPEGMLIGSGS